MAWSLSFYHLLGPAWFRSFSLGILSKFRECSFIENRYKTCKWEMAKHSRLQEVAQKQLCSTIEGRELDFWDGRQRGFYRFLENNNVMRGSSLLWWIRLVIIVGWRYAGVKCWSCIAVLCSILFRVFGALVRKHSVSTWMKIVHLASKYDVTLAF